MQSISSKMPPVSPLVTAEIRQATPLPRELAEIAAGYVSDPPPRKLIDDGSMAVHDFHRTAAYLAMPAEDRPPAYVTALDGSMVPVNVIGQFGFETHVEVPAGPYQGTFIFDASKGEFSIGLDLRNRERPSGPVLGQATVQSQANGALVSKSSRSPEEDLKRVRALLDLNEDSRPAIVVTDKVGNQVFGQVRDARGSCVLVDVQDKAVASTYMFDIDKGELNFEIDNQDLAAHASYVQALGDVANPFRAADKV